jgi:nitric oxide reductase subunit B
MFGDTIFAFGAVVLGWFVLGLITGHSYDRRGYVSEGGWTVHPKLVDSPTHAGD